MIFRHKINDKYKRWKIPLLIKNWFPFCMTLMFNVMIVYEVLHVRWWRRQWLGGGFQRNPCKWWWHANIANHCISRLIVANKHLNSLLIRMTRSAISGTAVRPAYHVSLYGKGRSTWVRFSAFIFILFCSILKNKRLGKQNISAIKS